MSEQQTEQVTVVGPDQKTVRYTRRKPVRRGRRETAVPDSLLERMLELRVNGRSWNEIAAELTRQGAVSPTGKATWTVSMVKIPLGQYALDRYVREERERRAAASSPSAR